MSRACSFQQPGVSSPNLVGCIVSSPWGGASLPLLHGEVGNTGLSLSMLRLPPMSRLWITLCGCCNQIGP
ncbi:hypothetical protein XENTR_v10020216 [Xenopus tropicalis]|nr:hypothetical protein XENTR_v10020216 [Xenopus tropicalis]